MPLVSNFVHEKESLSLPFLIIPLDKSDMCETKVTSIYITYVCKRTFAVLSSLPNSFAVTVLNSITILISLTVLILLISYMYFTFWFCHKFCA